MPRYICIHGHFYQPPRESPWTNTIEDQPSASPFPNWNHRIAYECYDANTKAAILTKEGSVDYRINNYEWISYNFGPTLLRWMNTYTPKTHDAIVEADKRSVQEFGYGTALAQVFHHAILPLCNRRDKKTEVRWGKEDFKKRYDRYPEGIWLAETAADVETLEVLAQEGFLFTILAPEQCKRFRPIGWQEWREEPVDTTQPYKVELPSGLSITIFFYHGDLAQDVAFRGGLNNGESFGKKIISVAKTAPKGSLTHFATDGESYGHHHRYGEVALAYCIKTLREDSDVVLTNYASYLAEHPPAWEAQIHEPSAWSCAHGVGRWSANCGCVIDPKRAGQQEWRPLLRSALNWLRDQLAESYESELEPLIDAPWLLRDGMMQAQLSNTLEDWIHSQANSTLETEQVQKVKDLLHIQTYALQMFTSCGWFFDHACGIEPVQILRYAARAIELQREVMGEDLEEDFVRLLLPIKTLNPDFPTGLELWSGLVHAK